MNSKVFELYDLNSKVEIFVSWRALTCCDVVGWSPRPPIPHQSMCQEFIFFLFLRGKRQALLKGSKKRDITKLVKKESKRKSDRPPKQTNLQLLTLNSLPLPFCKIRPYREPIIQRFINRKGQLHLILLLALKDHNIPFIPQTPTDRSQKIRSNNRGKTLQIIDSPTWDQLTEEVRERPRNPKMRKKESPNHIHHGTMNKQMIHQFLLPQANATLLSSNLYFAGGSKWEFYSEKQSIRKKNDFGRNTLDPNNFVGEHQGHITNQF